MKIDKARDALIVVDVQNDFCPGGALAVSEGDQIIPLINRIAPQFDVVVFTRDWHPADHISFSDDPRFVDKSWPRHCIAGTLGAQFHPGLHLPEGAIFIDKGADSEMEAYSGFQDTGLAESLRQNGITRLFICGLATDYCVKNTVLDALEEGFGTVVLTDAVRGVDIPTGSAATALEEMQGRGARFAVTSQLSST